MVGIPGGPLCFRGAQAACVGWLACGTGVTGGAGAPHFHQSKRHRHQFRNPTGACVPDSFPPGTSLMILMQFSRFSKFPRPRWFVLSPEEPLPAPQGPCLSPLASRGPSGQAHFAAPKAGHAARCPPAVTSAEPGGPPVVRGGTAEAPGGRLRAGLGDNEHPLPGDRGDNGDTETPHCHPSSWRPRWTLLSFTKAPPPAGNAVLLTCHPSTSRPLRALLSFTKPPPPTLSARTRLLCAPSPSSHPSTHRPR